MKLLGFPILLILLHVANGSDGKFRKLCLDMFNKERYEVAKEKGWANMNQLEYGERHEKLIQDTFDVYEDRCINRNVTTVLKNLQNMDNIIKIVLNPDSVKKYIGDVGSQKAACAYKKCKETGVETLAIAVDINSLVDPINGSPGSACPNNRQPDVQMLCELKKKKSN
ncbi:hypothetical protein B9Z55_026733 [Caenorhabditis nigoni]|uniref:DUF19 domain-containing protein n=1 Tax=Caenorhabditis nigoni TaxID=1611254 RepID=A0A2G5SH52_9PELO|nr:hypothetical protein B9Z55_026733 [Caenorhabditis nigoni]